jgi:hypothetical protein
LHCGYPHPDQLLGVLSLRQLRELEIYSRIEPIGGMMECSRPVKDDTQSEQEGRAMFDRIRHSLGSVKRKG